MPMQSELEAHSLPLAGIDGEREKSENLKKNRRKRWKGKRESSERALIYVNANFVFITNFLRLWLER